jgi:hypothetical protein
MELIEALLEYLEEFFIVRPQDSLIIGHRLIDRFQKPLQRRLVQFI